MRHKNLNNKTELKEKIKLENLLSIGKNGNNCLILTW